MAQRHKGFILFFRTPYSIVMGYTRFIVSMRVTRKGKVHREKTVIIWLRIIVYWRFMYAFGKSRVAVSDVE